MTHDRNGNAIAGEVVGFVVTIREFEAVWQAHKPCGLASRD
jgi:hypothetical protein